MQLNFELNLFLIGCPDKLLATIKDAARSAPYTGENYTVVISHADTPDQSMCGFAVIIYGNDHSDFIAENISETEILILDHAYDISLIKKGVSDIIEDAHPDNRLYTAVVNLIRRCYFRRRFELRDNMVKSYFEMSDNMLWTKDLEDFHMDINHFIVDLVGKPLEELEGRHEVEIYNLDPNDPGCGESDKYVRNSGLSSSFFESLPDKTGNKHHLSVLKSPWFDKQGRIVGTIGIGKDVTELMNQRTRFNTFINSLDYIVVITDRDNKVIQVNRAFGDLTDDSRVDLKTFDDIIAEHFTPSECGSEYDFTRYDDKNGSQTFWHMSTFALHDFWGEYTGNIYILEDVTTQREQSRQILKMMRTDPLTGVNNKAGMYDDFRKSDRQGKASFLLVSIDNFKYIGNTYGHETADRFLQDLSKLLMEVLHDGDITRYSENEFFVMLPGSLYEGQIRRRSRQLIDRAALISGYPDDITQKCPIYIGALYDEYLNEYIDTVVKKCEVAMLHAKKSNTSRYYVSYGS